MPRWLKQYGIGPIKPDPDDVGWEFGKQVLWSTIRWTLHGPFIVLWYSEDGEIPKLKPNWLMLCQRKEIGIFAWWWLNYVSLYQNVWGANGSDLEKNKREMKAVFGSNCNSDLEPQCIALDPNQHIDPDPTTPMYTYYIRLRLEVY